MAWLVDSSRQFPSHCPPLIVLEDLSAVQIKRFTSTSTTTRTRIRDPSSGDHQELINIYYKNDFIFEFMFYLCISIASNKHGAGMLISPLFQIWQVSLVSSLVVDSDWCTGVLLSPSEDDLIIVWIWDGTGISVSVDNIILLLLLCFTLWYISGQNPPPPYHPSSQVLMSVGCGVLR